MRNDIIILDSSIHDERYYTAVALYLLGIEMWPNEVGIVMETFNILKIRSTNDMAYNSVYISDILGEEGRFSNNHGKLPDRVYTADLSVMWETFGRDIVKTATKSLIPPLDSRLERMVMECTDDKEAFEYMKHHKTAIEGTLARHTRRQTAVELFYNQYFNTWEQWYNSTIGEKSSRHGRVDKKEVETDQILGSYAVRDFVGEVTNFFYDTSPNSAEQYNFAVSAITVIMHQLIGGIRSTYVNMLRDTKD